MRYRLTEQQKIERRARRADQRETAAARADDNRSWHEKRKALAEVARAKLRRARAKTRAKAEKTAAKEPRITVEPYVVSKHGTRIDSTLGTALFGVQRVTGNHAERRAMGARGKVRKPRRRELPAAEARRIERNRKAWVS